MEFHPTTTSKLSRLRMVVEVWGAINYSKVSDH